ncbi:MAG: sialidase family protein, partial [Acidimicrobiales bacterium]
FAGGTVDGDLALWYSANGRQWSRLAGAEKVVAGSDDPHITCLLETSNAVYAAGWELSGANIDAALWESSNGIDWHGVQAAHDVFGGEGDHVITAIAQVGTILGQAGTELVAVGGARTGTEWSPASWVSPDGASWSQPVEAFPLGERPQQAQAVQPGEPLPAASQGTIVRDLAVTAAGPGGDRLIAVGGSQTAQRMWQSADGLRWSEKALPEAAADATGWRATFVASDGQTTLIGDGQLGQPHLLVDGQQGWAEPSTNPAVFGPVQDVADPTVLAAAPASTASGAGAGGLLLSVAVGSSSQTVGSRRPSESVLRSADGANWAVGTSPVVPPAEATATTAFGPGWVAAGKGAGRDPTSATGSTTGSLAIGWTSDNGSSWTAPQTLDPDPGIGPQRPEALCSTTSTLVAVGRGAQAGTGSEAMAWWSSDGSVWNRSTINPAPATGSSEAMSGCLAGSGGFVAFGESSGPGGKTVPAIWGSTTGSGWARRSISGFGPGAGNITSVARDDKTWLAVVREGRPTLRGIPATANQLWYSSDGGSSWQQLGTSGPQWQGGSPSQVDLVAFLDGTPVVAGRVAGGLAVWSGAPVAR